MEEYIMSYREVIPDQVNTEKWKDITLNSGGIHSVLQDIKVAEKAGGYTYKDFTRNRNRFIYWRTSHDILEISEISLDVNLYENNVSYKFVDSPVLAVSIFETNNSVVILVATVSSIHNLSFPHPNNANKREYNDIKPLSIFNDATVQTASHPSTFYVIGQTSTTNNPIAHTASCCLNLDENEALFSLAYQTSLMLFTMNIKTGQTNVTELKEHYYVPRIFSNITGALRGKRNVTDSQYATSLIFDQIDKQTFLYGLYRDDHIRMWSTKTGQLITSVNCLQDGIDVRPQGPQINLLRKASTATICAFLCYADGSKFITIKTMNNGQNEYTLNRTNVISAPLYDLVDFELNDFRIWGLWCNSQGDFNVSSCFITPGHDLNWVTAALEPPPDRYSIPIERGMDPRQAYCSYIFHPGKFQKYVIAKALTMFRRSNIISDMELPISVLKDRVCLAIENEINNEIKDYEITDDEFIEISLRLWNKFYSCCEQYHIKASQPMGLIQLESVGGICVVKKNMFSLLRPCEPLEHLMLAGDNGQSDDLIGTTLYNSGGGDNHKLTDDFVQLVTILAVLEQNLLDDVKIEIDKKMYQLQLPNVFIGQLVADMCKNEYEDSILPKNFIVELRQCVQTITDLPGAMILLLDTLRMDHGQPEAMQTHPKLIEFSRVLLSMGNLFGSNYGISFLAESLRQTALIRYSLSRNLLILQMILHETFTLQCSAMEIVRSRCMPETVVFVQAYYVMVWLCDTPVNSTSSSSSTSTLETNIQRLNFLHIADSQNYLTRTHAMSLLELFLRGRGAQTGLALLADGPYKNINEPLWQLTLLPLVTIIGQLVWAVSGNFVFGEWLIGSSQHILIQEYVRLLNSWCEWNNCSRHFILAISHLDNGERHKAYDLFMKAGKGVSTEPFLIENILNQSSTQTSPDELTINEGMAIYYLKVIQLFEQYSALDCVIMMAQAAIGLLSNKSDPQMAMFQSIVFSNHLALEHYEKAYHSLIDNAELSRRKDCLRQLVICLFQVKRLDLLMHFPYVGLQDELENIIESRARSMMVENNDHYDFLYSFHITKGNMRKASSIMYERSMRYLIECNTVSEMQSRYHCLLACINTLNLVDEKYAWIAKPVINDDDDVAIDDGDDRMDTNSIIDQQKSFKEKVIVLEIKDLKKELLLTEAILLVAKYTEKIGSILNADAPELIAILSSLGLYTAAIRLSIGFNINIAPILESVASACVTASSTKDINEAWTWLLENDITDLSIKDSAIDTAWNLLKDLVITNELENSTILHKAVSRKIITSGAFLPQWLYSSYKRANTPELLYLLISSGRLIEATELAKEYIWGMLGRGTQYFNLKNSLTSTQPALCFPINNIDLLLYGLKINSKQDVEYQECFDELKKLVQYYIETAQRVSHDKLEMRAIEIQAK